MCAQLSWGHGRFWDGIRRLLDRKQIWPTHSAHHVLAPIPPLIATALISLTNPVGALTNSDFESVALITGTALLASHVPLHHATLWCASDNTPAVSWSPKALHPPTPPMLFSSACSSKPAAEEPLAYDLHLFPVPLM